MFVRLWNYLQGYVIVEVVGFSMERFMNIAVNNNIYLWDIKQIDDKLYFKTSIADFKRLKPCARTARCRFKAKYKKGIPFIAYKYKKRKMLTLGAMLFVGLLWLLTSFVWLIEIQGNQRIGTLDIITSLEKKGYTVGKFKAKFNLREAESYLIQTYPDFVWVGVKFEGTKLVVQVAEIVPKPKVIDENIPCNIVAKKDALITYIATYKGMPLVKKGDTVKKGELLVAGQMPLGVDDPNIYVTSAKAQIKGKTIYHLKDSLSTKQMIKDYTTKNRKKYSLRFFNHSLTLFNQKIDFKYYDRVITKNQLSVTRLFPLPFALEVEDRLEYIPVLTTFSQEDVKDKLIEKLWNQLSDVLSEDATLLKKDIFFTISGDTITATLSVLAEEDIGCAIQLQNEGVN